MFSPFLYNFLLLHAILFGDTMNTSPGTILRADAQLRRATFFIVAVIIFGGVAGFVLLQAFLRDAHTLAVHSPEEAIHKVGTLLKIMAVLMGVSVIGLGIFSVRLSLRTIRDRQFPPPGTGVIRDTLVVTGRSAQRRGRLLFICSIGLIITGVLLPLLSWRVVHLLSP